MNQVAVYTVVIHSATVKVQPEEKHYLDFLYIQNRHTLARRDFLQSNNTVCTLP